MHYFWLCIEKLIYILHYKQNAGIMQAKVIDKMQLDFGKVDFARRYLYGQGHFIGTGN